MSDFNNYKLFKNVGIRSSDNKLIVMNVNKSNNVSFYSSDGGTNNIDVMSINSLINKSQNEDLNLSSLNGTTINPVITINNNHNDCRIMTNLNVYGNVNITKNLNVSNTVVNHNLIIPKYDNDYSLLSNVIGSIYYNTTENMYEGYSNDGWQPLGGFSKTKDATIHKNLNVFGNLNVTGNINQINSDQIHVLDKNIVLASNNNNDTYINGAGLILKSISDKKFIWDSSTDSWTSTHKITAPSLTVTNIVNIAADNLSYSGTAVTATGAELNYLDITTLGTSEASKAVTAAANGNITIADGTVDIASHDGTNGLKLAGTLVTATAAELNYLDITTLGTSQASKAVTAASNGNVTIANGGMIKTTGIGSFGSINCGVGTFGSINSTACINLPVGTTLNRPVDAIPGTIRYNSETYNFEGYGNGVWVNLTDGWQPSYYFTSQTFGNYGALGRNGPTLAQAKAELDQAPTWKDNTSFFNVVNGIQYWTVPKNGNYTITAYGADAENRLGGKGAKITGTFTLVKNEIIRILVGQRPEPYGPYNGGGAGGTFVVRSPYDTEVSILVIAGGGGGAHNYSSAPRTNGNMHGQGVVASDYWGGYATGSGSTTTSPIYNIEGGKNGQGGKEGNTWHSNGGAGFFAPLSTSYGIAHGFIDSTNPGQGGEGNVGISQSSNLFLQIGYAGQGGFGGGGRHGATHGGGGGGFSGGGGSMSSPYQGGGGSSYNSGSNKSEEVGINGGWVGQGKVVISYASAH